MSGSDSTCATVAAHTVLERVLLAIINAHTTSETAGRQAERLQSAMRALVGPATPHERDLERALVFMARERQRDICDLEMAALLPCHTKPRAARSITELAKLAAREVLGCATAAELRTTASLLCESFRDGRKACNAEPDNIREALEAEAVQRLCGELAEWGVCSRL